MSEIMDMAEPERIKNVTVGLDCAFGIIPDYTGNYDILKFINMCELSLSIIKPKCVPVLLAYIINKLTPKLFALIKYQDITTWDDIKMQLISELKGTQLKLQDELRKVKMRSDETVNSYFRRVEEIHYKICNIINVDKDHNEAKVISLLLMGQTLAYFTAGLIKPIRKKVVKLWSSLEEAKHMAEIYEIEVNLSKQQSTSSYGASTSGASSSGTSSRHKIKNVNSGI